MLICFPKVHKNNVNRVKAKGKRGKVKFKAWLQLRIKSVQNETKSFKTKQGFHKGGPPLWVFKQRLDVVLRSSGDTGGLGEGWT